MKEEWKMYHGYRVSNTGRCQWNDNGVWREKKEKIKGGSLDHMESEMSETTELSALLDTILKTEKELEDENQ